MPEALRHELSDHVLDLRWSAQGRFLAAIPSQGPVVVFDALGAKLRELPGHVGGNGSVAWHPLHDILTTYGQDAVIRSYSLPAGNLVHAFSLEKGWAERVAWNSSGTMLAACVGKKLHVLDGVSGESRQVFSEHRSTVSDIVWHPSNADEIASVCDGGAQLWKVGTESPIARFDWGGASLRVYWSPDGRWIITGDQTPSVHLYDVRADYPLHIQGFQIKVKSMAWQGSGEWLAVAGGPDVTLWPCSGKTGPEGVNPKQLNGHSAEVTALDFKPDGTCLASGGRDGLVLLWRPHQSKQPAVIARSAVPISVVRWSPDGETLAFGTSGGQVLLFKLAAAVSSR